MKVNFALFIGFILRIVIAIWNGFWGPSFGAELDAQGFHQGATVVAEKLDFFEFSVGAAPYTNFLGTIYYLISDSLFLGSLVSCFVWLASATFLVKMMRLLSFDKSHQVKAMLIYALLPSSVLMTSVTLREPYQLLFVNLAIYAALKIYLHRSSIHWLGVIAGCIGMGILHGALFAFGLFIVAAVLVLLSMRGYKGISLIKLVVTTLIAVLVLIYGFSLFSGSAYNLEGGLDMSVATYQQGLLGVDARTHYKDKVEINGFIDLLLSIPVSFLQYLFEPMPWRISAIADIDSLSENLLRAWLIWRSWVGLRSVSVQKRRPLLFIFLSYVVIELIWSMGTINWGTSLRHHLPSIGLLVAAAFASPVTNKMNLRIKFRATKSVATQQ